MIKLSFFPNIFSLRKKNQRKKYRNLQGEDKEILDSKIIEEAEVVKEIEVIIKVLGIISEEETDRGEGDSKGD